MYHFFDTTEWQVLIKVQLMTIKQQEYNCVTLPFLTESK